ncbi:MAG: hypothetical protein LBT20_05005, partial [Clostridiales bacterium]|nr:hypothetical protein [Clostridiales bacterium]
MSENDTFKDIIRNSGFRYKKALGQNFITDTNLLRAIVSDSGAEASDIVIEIGTGAGSLTCALSEAARRVFSFEVDRSLEGVLSETLKGRENVEVIFRDVLKMSDGEINEVLYREEFEKNEVLCRDDLKNSGGETDMLEDRGFRVVANLPYYITTPLIMRFLESGLPVKSLTVMVQKEVAERITAKCGTKEFS